MSRLNYKYVLIALLGAGLFGGQAKAETLSDVMAYVYQVNPGLQAQRAALRALDESYTQARGGFGTNISASTGSTHYNDRRGGADIHADTASSALSVIQPLYTGGRVTERVRAAEAQIKAGRETLRRYELDLVLRVVAAYVGVQRDEEILRINQDTVAALTKELSDTQARFDVHEVTITDLAQAKARLAQARTQLLTAQAQLGGTRAQYFGVVGQYPGQLAPPPIVSDIPNSFDKALDAAEANNPQLQGARYSELSSRAALAEAKAERKPTVTARYDLERSPEVPYFSTPYDNIHSLSVTLSQPLFSAGQIASGVRQRLEENNRDRLTIDDTRLQVIQQVATDWEQLVALRQQLTSAQNEVSSDQVAYAGERQEEKFALRSTIEVLNSELVRSTAQQNLIHVRTSEYIGRVQLLADTGVLSAQMFSPDAVGYDPAANFQRVRNGGATPLEVPVRAFEALLAGKVGPEPPASIAQVRPSGPALPAEPVDADAPIKSIYSTLEQSDAAAAAAKKP